MILLGCGFPLKPLGNGGTLGGELGNLPGEGGVSPDDLVLCSEVLDEASSAGGRVADLEGGVLRDTLRACVAGDCGTQAPDEPVRT